jgi:hypothetical protein
MLQNKRQRLTWLLCLTFLSRLAFALVAWKASGTQAFLSPDSQEYISAARALLHGNFSPGGVPELVRTPGYPLLLTMAVVFNHFVIIAVLENIALGVITAYFIWHILEEIFPGSKVASWAILLYCFEPSSLTYSAKVLSDQLFCTQILLFVFLFARFLRNFQYRCLLLAAIALGLATYTRPISEYLGVWLIPFLIIFPRSASLARRTAGTIIFVIAIALTLAPWVARNIIVAQYPGFSSVSDISLYFYSAAAVRAKLDYKAFSDIHANEEQLYLRDHPEQRSWSQSQRFLFQRAEAKKIILHHLGMYFVIHFRGCVSVLFNPGGTESLNMLGLNPAAVSMPSRTEQGVLQAALSLIREYPLVGGILAILGLELLFYYALAVFGLASFAVEMRSFFVWIVLYFVLISGAPGVVARYRLPIMPLVCISAGLGLSKVLGRLHDATRPYF